jgi:hypothetical protein
MDDDAMRRALFEKLNDPRWKAQQDRRYRQIVGESDIEFSAPPATFRGKLAPSGLPPAYVKEEEPDSIEALWLGNWQRSAGAVTITRYPDDTIALDHPDGDRTIFQPCPAPHNRFTWSSETTHATGRRPDSHRCPDRYEDPAEALLQMHRAALAMFAELASEINR